MLRLTADDILAYAPSVQGRELQTLHQRKKFTVEARGDHVIYTPLETDEPGSHDKATLQRVCDAFSETNSLKPSDHDEQKTRNASHTLALIVKYLGSVVDGSGSVKVTNQGDSGKM